MSMQNEVDGNQEENGDGKEETNTEENPEEDEGCAALETTTVSVEKEQGAESNLDFIDKSEMSDEDFKSIKTIDDNLNDFEGKYDCSKKFT